jgi:DNA-binding CsgD family transcriptional regulator
MLPPERDFAGAPILTDRQAHVIDWIALGASGPEIAHQPDVTHNVAKALAEVLYRSRS